MAYKTGKFLTFRNHIFRTALGRKNDKEKDQGGSGLEPIQLETQFRSI
jgi:hypothetical protein